MYLGIGIVLKLKLRQRCGKIIVQQLLSEFKRYQSLRDRNMLRMWETLESWIVAIPLNICVNSAPDKIKCRQPLITTPAVCSRLHLQLRCTSPLQSILNIRELHGQGLLYATKLPEISIRHLRNTLSRISWTNELVAPLHANFFSQKPLQPSERSIKHQVRKNAF